jgi:multisubunit Na+/H+ antiporter MnhC subunit
VISFAMTAVTIVVALRNHADNGDDHVDAGEGDSDRERGK